MLNDRAHARMLAHSVKYLTMSREVKGINNDFEKKDP